MKITKLTTSHNPDRVLRKTLLDTDRLGEKVKNMIEHTNYIVDRKIDQVTGWLCDLVG